ncbi:MAG: hypothetical protein IPG45_37140 [Deltaproteobacteria bacterium]|nr:hypothetical protein [Deltaproteobacteria bacterium]
MKTWLMSLALALALPVVGATEAAASDVVSTVRGKVDSTADGSVVVQLVVSAKDRAALEKMPHLVKGIPSEVSRLGIHQNEVYGRFRFAPESQVATEIAKLKGQDVVLSFDRGQFVVKVERAINKR